MATCSMALRQTPAPPPHTMLPDNSHDRAELSFLCRDLAARAEQVDRAGRWPDEQLQVCREHEVFRWLLPAEFGGHGLADDELLTRYWQLSSACLTTAFILTQRHAAVRRIVDSDNTSSQRRWLPGLADGSLAATVGISQLSTSRRHLQRPVLEATKVSRGWQLNGVSPWVTGGDTADCLVIGGTLDDGRQVLLAVERDAPGVVVEPAQALVALAASCTGPVRFESVVVSDEALLAGPTVNVMASGASGGTGGLQTSTLALGLATAAVDYLARESEQRLDLGVPTAALRAELQDCLADVLALARGEPACSSEELRTRANQLGLRTTHAALTAAKGAGFVVGHPAGRWCREALFFLVWSCPQPVASATLCQLAGLD